MSEISSFTKEERNLADQIERAEQKRIAEDEAMRLKAEEAVLQAKEQGIQQEKLATARKLIAKGMPISDMMEVTGLSKETILKINDM